MVLLFAFLNICIHGTTTVFITSIYHHHFYFIMQWRLRRTSAPHLHCVSEFESFLLSHTRLQLPFFMLLLLLLFPTMSLYMRNCHTYLQFKQKILSHFIVHRVSSDDPFNRRSSIVLARKINNVAFCASIATVVSIVD